MIPIRKPGFNTQSAWWSVGRWLFKTGRFVFTLLVGGLVFAYFAGVIGFATSLFHIPVSDVTLRHVAWVIGVVVTAVGLPLGWVKVGFFGGGPKKEEAATLATDPAPAPKEVEGFWGNVGFFALLGVILGVVISTLLVMAWFSISVSPFAPASWSDSVHPAAPGELNSNFDDHNDGGFTTENPVVIRLFWMPTAILSALGALAGAVCWLWEKLAAKRISPT